MVLNTKPAVTVVLPVHNGEATIGETVASVLSQTFRDLLLIVVDDGSTDGTQSALEIVDDSRLLVISTPHSGSAASRNRGVDYVASDFVAFIDADDVWLPTKLEAQCAALERMPQAAVAYCWTDYVEADGSFLCPDGRPVFEGWVYEPLLTHNFIDCGSNILVRRQALLEVGGFDETLPVLEDWELHLRLAAQAPFVCVPEALVHYRQSPGSQSTRIALMEATFLRVVEKIFSRAARPIRSRRNQCMAFFYMYLAGKATQWVPTRYEWLTALRLLVKAVQIHPLSLLELWQRTWVVVRRHRKLSQRRHEN
jgi:glycosyltransferase involved in cell wall biosynthesis